MQKRVPWKLILVSLLEAPEDSALCWCIKSKGSIKDSIIIVILKNLSRRSIGQRKESRNNGARLLDGLLSELPCRKRCLVPSHLFTHTCVVFLRCSSG